MKNNRKHISTICAAMALAALLCPAADAAAAAKPAQNHAPSPSQAETTAVEGARQLNPSAVEILYSGGKTMTLDFYGPNIVRLFRDDNGGIIRDPQASPQASILTDNARRDPGGITVKTDEKAVTVASPRMSVSIDRLSGLLSITDTETGKAIVSEAAPASIESGKATLTFETRPDEYFYGGGVQNGRFSHKGKTIAIENTNNWVDGGVASPCPFYWSTSGYALLWHTFKPGLYDFGESSPGKAVISHNEGYLDVFLMTGGSPTELLGGFYQLTGSPVLMPKFGFYEGHLNAYNRDYWTEKADGFMLYEDGKRYDESQKDNGGTKESLNGEKQNYQFSARAAIDRYADNDMPLGWFLPNDGYGAGYGQAGTLDGNIANLKSFGDYARSKGVEIGLWTQSDLHPKDGVEALLQRDIVKEVRDAGVRVLKTDVAWVGWGYSFGLNGVADAGGIMPYYGANARPFIISLDGWAGTQRYATIWSGDQTGGDWEYIRFHIPTFIGSGLSGQPNITSDMDGIFGGKNVPVNVREFEWKTFTPMQLNMDGWGSNPKYPQILGEPAASINRTYLKLKSELMPYTYSIAAEAVDGKPMIRAMFLDYPNDYTLGTKTQYQFLYGPSFLVAPIYRDTRMDETGNDTRDGIYLPEGKWIDYFTGDTYTGGRIINNFDAPLWKLPVFVKSDAIIPMTLPNNNPSQIRKDFRAYEIYADKGCEFSEYDDDGKTIDYKNGRCSRTLIKTAVSNGKLTVSIATAEGSFDGFEPMKETELRVNVSAKPKKVTAKAGGKSIRIAVAESRSDYDKGTNVCFYDTAPDLNRFATSGSDFAKVKMTKNPQLLVKIDKTDISENAVEVSVAGFSFAPDDRLLVSAGPLSAPEVAWPDSCIGTFTLTPAWKPAANADFYEVEFDNMLYSTIRGCSFTFEDLAPETEYKFKVRAVNKDGHSEWTMAEARTKSNPLEFAIQGIKATTSCRNQSGQAVGKLFDFNEKTVWHSEWGKTAVPFEMTLDLRAVSQLERLDYIPREDAGNGTLLKGTVSYSTDRQSWSEPVAFAWDKTAETKTFRFGNETTARYLRISVSEGAGGFGSGREMYVFKTPGSESIIQGDINHDKRIDENDLTSYMNYTGLRSGDSDFDYVSSGDINGNGLIDAYDISVVSTELDGGVRNSSDKVRGRLVLTAKKAFEAGDIVEIKVSGKNLHYVNGLSFALPYDTKELEYTGIELIGMKDMVNLTYDRLHTNGQKALYPTFVNRGNNFLLDEGDHDLFIIRFRAKAAGKLSPSVIDGMLIDRNLGVAEF